MSPGIRHRNQLTAKAWEKAVQEQGNVFPQGFPALDEGSTVLPRVLIGS